MFRKMKDEKGFTLIELMIVLIIMGILVTVVVLNLGDEPDKARVQKARMDIKRLETALKMFKIDNAFYPSTEQGIEALLYEPTVGRMVKDYKEGGYVEALPLDPWDNPYIYISPGVKGRNYDLISYGADGLEGGEDFNEDIVSWDLN
ncbi:type II secretion system major pseudopilin GspG [Thermodesulfobacteriota bacterium]